MEYIKNINNWVYNFNFVNGKIEKVLLGVQCPHCNYFASVDETREDWAVDAFEHITYCSPSHKRAVAFELF